MPNSDLSDLVRKDAAIYHHNRQSVLDEEVYSIDGKLLTGKTQINSEENRIPVPLCPRGPTSDIQRITWLILLPLMDHTVCNRSERY
jgi:hypothetical protein